MSTSTKALCQDGEIVVQRISASCPPVFVVDRHGDALRYWRNACPPGRKAEAPPRFSVLHLDSHADMHLDWFDSAWTQPDEHWHPPPLEMLQARILSEVNITNFQPAAIFLGLVHSVVWVRSDFELGKYNSPAPGHYRRLIGLPDYSKENSRPDLGVIPEQLSSSNARPLLCVWELDPGSDAGSFYEYGDFLPDECRREIRKPRHPGVPLEVNTSWEDMPNHWLSGRPPTPGYSFEHSFSTVTLAQLECPSMLETVQHRLDIAATGGSPWILDVDLDFFATFSPSLSAPLEKHNWLSAEASNAFASWAVRLRILVSSGLEPACKHDLFSPAVFQQHTAQEIIHMASLPAAQHRMLTADHLLVRFRSIAPTCHPPRHLLQALSDLVNNLTDEQHNQWLALDGEDWHNVMQPHGPHYFPSCDEIRCAVARLEPLLKEIPYPPQLITIARSTDMYLPAQAASLIEWEMLLLIRRIWLPALGDVSLPSELDKCSEEHVALILQGVEFHASEPNCLRLQPQAWPFINLSNAAESAPSKRLATCARSYAKQICTEVYEIVD